MTHFFSSPMQQIQLFRAHKKQKRTALQMLALSGVVRPSHIELRYSTPITSITAFRRQPTPIGNRQSAPLSLPSGDTNATLNMNHARRKVQSFFASLVRFVNKPLTFGWTKQADL